MLSLTRRPSEAVHIDTPEGRVTVTVIQVRGQNVRLAFEAPRRIPIMRSEVTPNRESS